MRKKVLMIVNPISGKKKKERYFSLIRLYLKRQGYDIYMKFTTKEKNASYIIENFNKPYDVILACGGDGTLSEITHGLYKIKKQVPIGFIPSGTTNDYARSLHIPIRKKKLSKNLSSYKVIKTDLGTFNEKTFNYVAAFGLFSKASYSVHRKLKNTIGRLAYILYGIKELFSYKTYKMRFEFDDKIIEDNFIFGSISNSRYIGGFKVFRKRGIQFNDGEFEVLLIKSPKNLLDTILLIFKVIFGNFKDKNIVYFKTKKLHIQSLSNECVWSIDGEFGGDAKDVTITVKRDWNYFLVP